MTTEQIRDYYRLCDQARSLGVPVDLADPRSPRTVAALADAVYNARAAAMELRAGGIPGDGWKSSRISD